MRKIITFSVIVAVVALMSNCSPKVAKKTAKTETKSEKRNETPTTDNTSRNNNAASTGSTDVVKNAQADRSNAEQVQMLSQVNEQRTDAGAKLYGSTCNQCHELYSPGSRTATSWVEIMKEMGPKAKLEVSPYLTISAYLVQHAKG